MGTSDSVRFLSDSIESHISLGGCKLPLASFLVVGSDDTEVALMTLAVGEEECIPGATVRLNDSWPSCLKGNYN